MRDRKKKIIKNIVLLIVLTVVIIKGILLVYERKKNEAGGIIVDFLQNKAEQAYLMPVSYIKAGGKMTIDDGVAKGIVREVFPLYAYADKGEDYTLVEDEFLKEFYRQKEGSDEDRKDIEEDKLDYDKNALHIENSMLAEMERENRAFYERQNVQEEQHEHIQESVKEHLPQEQEMAFSVAQYPAYTYDWEEQWGYEELISNFYAIDASTDLKEEYLDLDKLLYQDLSVNKESDGPQILIYHTHSQEGFIDSVKGDASTTIVGAGEKLAKLLTEEYGFKVLHHAGEYDVENRDYAYSNSLPEIERILEENPSIEVVIDLHRDEMQEGKKLVMDLQGRPTARFMFFDGMSYIRNKGDISYLENPYIQDNLAFSFQAQVTANQYYPGIARKIYLKAYRYNLHLRPKSMLIELGAQTNTVEEIMNACDPLAHIISIVLNGEV